MIRHTRIVIVFILFLVLNTSVKSQFFPSFGIAGGPTVGWFFNDVKELNSQLQLGGFPELSDGGYLTLGGGGFIDMQVGKNYLRIGGFGTGFETNKDKKYNDTTTKAVNYSLGIGGIDLEFAKPFGKFIDIHIGAQIATGRLILELYQYGSSYGNYNTIFGELQSNGSSTNLSRVFKNRFYSVQPLIGIGFLIKTAIYLKLDAGYHFAAMGDWKVDNDVKVDNFPDGITSKGFTLNLGINFGIFTR
jgi:hypothetical protein